MRVDEARGQLTNLRVLDEGLDASRLFEVPNLEGAVLGAGGELRERREKERRRERAGKVWSRRTSRPPGDKSGDGGGRWEKASEGGIAPGGLRVRIRCPRASPCARRPT